MKGKRRALIFNKTQIVNKAYNFNAVTLRVTRFCLSSLIVLGSPPETTRGLRKSIIIFLEHGDISSAHEIESNVS